MMRTARFVLFFAMLLLALPMMAVDPAVDVPKKSDETEKFDPLNPDYSKHAMMIFVWEILEENEDEIDPWVWDVPVLDGRIGFHLAAPMGVTTASLFALPDPFAIAPISAAYTPKTFRDRWRIWRTERRLGIDDD